MESPDKKHYAIETIDCGDYVHFIVTGQDSNETSELYWTDILTYAKINNVKKILVEEALEGNTSILDAYMFIEKLSAVASRSSVIAFYDRYESSVNSFAETVAQNRGGRVRVFSSLDAAKDWLNGIN